MKISIKLKTVGMVLLVGIVLTVAAATASYRIYADNVDEHYRTIAMNLAKTEAFMLDGEQVKLITEKTMGIYRESFQTEGQAPDLEQLTEAEQERYYAQFREVENLTAYEDSLLTLRELENANGVLSVYICYMDKETGRAVYIADGTVGEERRPTGTYVAIEQRNLDLIGQGIYDLPAYITKRKGGGWLCSASSGIYDKEGRLIANAYVDISMDVVMQDRRHFLMNLCAVLCTATVIMMVFLALFIHYAVVSPINNLAKAAGTFVSDRKKQGGKKDTSALARLQVDTGDEIGVLADAIKKMELEINTYIENITLITAEKERIGAELNVATQIQADMLPNIFPAYPEYKEFDIYASMAPAKEVGGDFYDFFMVDEIHLAVVIADVSGKGVPAALFMVIAKTLIKNHAQAGEEPKDIFTNVNNQLNENNEVGMFVTGWIGILNIVTGHVVYSNAGHNCPVLLHKDGRVEWIKSRPCFVLAGMKGVRYQQYDLCLEEGDALYLYTDGVTEAMNGEEELFGEERLEKVLSLEGSRGSHPEDLLNLVADWLAEFSGEAKQADDITMLGLYWNGRNKEEDGWEALKVPAQIGSFDKLNEFVSKQLQEAGADARTETQILVAVEEIFVNIVNYAYEGGTGDVEIKTFYFRRSPEEGEFRILFRDEGVPFNPLESETPDISLSAEERQVGGLGIFMVRMSMDEVKYEYREGKNCLTLMRKMELQKMR